MSIPFDLWGQRGWAGMEVVGESHYSTSIRALFGADLKGDGSEIVTTVRLVPDPGNRFDPNAVGVWAGGRQVGHLPREEAARYAPVLASLIGQGWEPRVSAHVWAAQWTSDHRSGGDLHASVRLELAEPHMLVPANVPPAGPHRMLPVGGAIQVTGEEHHLDALVPWLRPEGECWVHVSLHELTEQLARSSRTVVEVRIDGARVGQLTPRMSGELLPAIRHLSECGQQAGARAIVKGNRIKAEVVLHVARAHELPHSWLTEVAARPEPASAAVAGEPPWAPGPGPAAAAVAEPPRARRAEPVAATVTREPAGMRRVEPVATAVSGGDPARVRQHGAIPPAPRGIKFVVPPDWPQPPAGWCPPVGWRPDPTWPVEPEGWQWWVPTWDQ